MLTSKMKTKLIAFYRDDVGKRDITTALVRESKSNAAIVAKEKAFLAGIEEVSFLGKKYGLKVKHLKKDGQKVKKNQKILVLFGSNKKILQLERTMLNILGRMSGISTECRKAVEKVKKNRKLKLALTRKTTPGFSLFEKKAAELGGVWEHRLNLSSAVLLKDNHLKYFNSVTEAIKKARKKYKMRKIEIEVETIKQAKEAAENNVDIIMLDNMSVKTARKAIAEIRKRSKAKIELSGGINLKNLKQYATLNSDIISMGYLTKQAKSIDFSLEM